MVSKKIVLHFPRELVEKPVIYNVTTEYRLVFKILKAEISPDAEGLLVIELSGDQKDVDAGIDHLDNLGLKVQPLEKDISRDEEKCTHCSACIVHCPTKALTIKDRRTMMVEFDKSKCILCEACIPICPARAMSVTF
jgi:ferredoxin